MGFARCEMLAVFQEEVVLSLVANGACCFMDRLSYRVDIEQYWIQLSERWCSGNALYLARPII